MTDPVEQRHATHFRLGEIDGPVLRGPMNQQQDYSFSVELKRRGVLKDESARVWVRFSSIQVFNRLDEHVRCMARWIATGRLNDHLAKVVAAPDRVFEAIDEEVEEFFRQVDPQKVAQDRDRWLEVQPQHRRVGF